MQAQELAWYMHTLFKEAVLRLDATSECQIWRPLDCRPCDTSGGFCQSFHSAAHLVPPVRHELHVSARDLCSVPTHLRCRGSDPVARAAVTAFVLGPMSAAAAQYNITGTQVTAVRQYLDGLVRADVAPEFQAGLLGPLGGPSSGGLVVVRTIEEWMDGRVNSAAHLKILWQVYLLSGMHVQLQWAENL